MSRATREANMARWRCLEVGCNPMLRGHNVEQHKEQTGHRVAKWPVRSEAGKAKQRERNRLNPPPWGYGTRAGIANGGQSGDELGQWVD